MSLISIEKMEFYAYHGCFDEERKMMISSKLLENIARRILNAHSTLW